ncbi:MAG TPA: hypothetical protein VFS43_27280 [Polyangiaceae bacterium]|nr:hypothetical protein [Polyangiaceae bacterium]
MNHPAPPSFGFRWLTPGVFLVPALVLGSAVLRGGLLLTPHFTGRALPPAQWASPQVWGSELVAIVAGALLAVWAMQGATRLWVALRAVAGGVVAGLLEAFAVTAWRSSLPKLGDEAWWQVAPSLSLAEAGAQLAYWSVPLSAALGLSSIALVLPASEAAKRGSLDGVDNAAAPAGAWLLSSGALGLWLLRETPLAPLAGAAVALGAVSLLAAQVRAEERVGWLRRVQAGLEPNVHVDERAPSLAGVQPLVAELDASGVGRSGVAVHRAPSRGKGYRAGEGAGTPLARVPLDERPLRTAWGARLDAKGHASLGQLALGLGATLGLGLAAALVPFAIAVALRVLPH